MNILVTGTLGFDFIMDFPGRFADRIMPEKIHKISLSFLVDKLSKQFGGTAGNIAYGLNLLNTRPKILAAAGDDFEPYEKFLEAQKIDTDFIEIFREVGTGSYFVITDKDDNQIGSFFSGATKYAKNLSIDGPVKKTDFDLVVIAPNDPEAMNKYVSDCIKLNIPYLYDPAFQIGSISKKDLLKGISQAKIFIGNDYEISLTEKNLEISHRELLRLVPVLITTLGANGSLIETKSEKIRIDAVTVKKVVDPTGAGDAYRAGFISGYIRKYPLKVCGQMGAVAAAFAVENYGTTTYNFQVGEFQERYKQNFNQKVTV